MTQKVKRPRKATTPKPPKPEARRIWLNIIVILMGLSIRQQHQIYRMVRREASAMVEGKGHRG